MRAEENRTAENPTEENRTAAPRLRLAVPPVLVLALAAGYLGVDLFVGLDEPISGATPPLVHAALVALQALAIAFRHRAPVLAFSAVVALDAVLLGTSGGEFANGALAVMIAAYALTRSADMRIRYTAVITGAVVTAVVSGVAMTVTGIFPPVAVLGAAVARAILQYVVPVGIAEFLLGREKLVQALRDRAELAERERINTVEREIAGVRAAMARELHDIAAHHLSGIIVGAQAASALVGTDPERTREMLRTVQLDARMTLTDLRRTVGLLRSDDDETATTGHPTPAPTLARVADLVDVARARGQKVEFTVDGEPLVTGPLAETAGYRMVQESLANAARHAPGAPSRVHVEYGTEGVRITVENGASADVNPAAARSERGYGIAGMEERADLVGAGLSTGSRPEGGWRNVLELPLDIHRSES